VGEIPSRFETLELVRCDLSRHMCQISKTTSDGLTIRGWVERKYLKPDALVALQREVDKAEKGGATASAGKKKPKAAGGAPKKTAGKNTAGAKATGTDRIELYTESYAADFSKGKEAAIAPFVEAAKLAKEIGIGLNAGHDLNLDNLNYFAKNISWLDEVSIGHALICDALYYGLENVVQLYLRELRVG